MERARHDVGVTMAPLGDPATALAWTAAAGIRFVQLSATQPGTRPRELRPGARRDLRARLARLELGCCGIDALVPAAHFVDPAFADRAVEAACAACGLAADLGRVPVTLRLPPADAGAAREQAARAIAAEAERLGVTVADLGGGDGCAWPPVGACVDTASEVADGRDPASTVLTLGARLAAVRVVDLLRGGARGPFGAGESGRVDLLGFRVALEAGGRGLVPVIDCRGWHHPANGVGQTLRAWGSSVSGA